MKKLTLEHDVACSAEHFWALFFDPEFNRRLYLEELEFPEFSVLEQNETSTGISRTTRAVPKMDVPKPVAKALGDSFGYEESATWTRATGTCVWTMKPDRLQGKLNNEGKLTIEPVGDNQCRRVVELSIEAKIFGIGGMVETASAKQLTDGWNRSAAFTTAWLEANR